MVGISSFHHFLSLSVFLFDIIRQLFQNSRIANGNSPRISEILLSAVQRLFWLQKWGCMCFLRVRIT